MFIIAKLYKEEVKVKVEKEEEEEIDRKPILLENGEGKYICSFNKML